MTNNIFIIDICGTIFNSNTTFDFLKYFFSEKPWYKVLTIIRKTRFLIIVNAIVMRLSKIDLLRYWALTHLKGYSKEQLNKMADTLAEEMARLADMADDDMLWELSHRSIFSAWKKGAVLWILNDQTWSKSIGDFVEWFCYYDLWSKVKVFGDLFKNSEMQSDEAQKSGPKNMLDSLDNSFNEQQLEALRINLGKNKEGTKHLLNVWKYRGFITYSAQTGMYTKTKEYLKGE